MARDFIYRSDGFQGANDPNQSNDYWAKSSTNFENINPVSTYKSWNRYTDARKRLIEALGRDIPEAEFQEIMLSDSPYVGDVSWEELKKLDPVTYENIKGVKAEVQQAALERVGKSNFEDLSSDPRLKADQMASLDALKELANNGGMTAQDKANLARIQNDNAQADRGRRDAILQNAHARGMSGGGQELLAQLQSSQAATDRSAQQGLDVAGMAQQRALDALMRSGQMAGSIRGQDWDENARRAAAMDAINQFNASQANDMNRFNTGALNRNSEFNAGVDNQTNQFNTTNQLRTKEGNRDYQAGVDQFNAVGRNNTNRANVNARQQNADNNTNIRNQQTTYNNVDRIKHQYNADSSTWDRRIMDDKAAMEAMKEDADRDDKMKNNRFSTGVHVIGSIASMMSDKNCKKNIKKTEPIDIEHFIAKLKPSTFEYKNNKHGDGLRVGVMAQDLMATPLGAATVTETPEGLAVDSNNLLGVTLAALKHLSDKVDNKKKG